MRKTHRSSKITISIIVMVILAIFTFLFLQIFSNEQKETKYIAYIGLYRKDAPKEKAPQRPLDILSEKLLKKKIKELTAELKYTNLELKPFECNYDPEKSKSLYKQISSDEDIVLVIDSTWGVHISAAAFVIKENQIPVIGINPNKEGNDFGESTLFLGTEDDVPSYLVAFASAERTNKAGKILDFDEAYFIYESDYKLKYNFYTSFLKYNIKISNQFEVDRTKLSEQNPNMVFSELLDAYKENRDKKRALFICTHYKWGDKIIDFIDKDKKLNNFIILGPESITKKVFNGEFGNNTNNELILFKTPEDAASKHVHLDTEFFEKTHPELLEKIDKMSTVKRCNDAMSIVKAMFKNKTEPGKLTKKDFYRYFKTFRNNTIYGENNVYNFNNGLMLEEDRHFVSFKNGKIYSCPIQLNNKKESIPNLIFGLEIQSIYDIDLNSSSFFADFYYWVKFAKPDAKNKENQTIAKSILFQNMKQGESSIKLVKEKIYNDTTYHLYKVSGKFFANYQPQNYPFDSQEINITAQILEPVRKSKISFDKESFKKDRNKMNNFKLNEWNVLKYYVTVDNTITEKMRGEPDALKGELKKYRNISFRFVVKRKFWGPFLQVILPVLIIGFLSIASLYVRDPTFDRLGGVHIGIFFSIIAFSIALAELTPNSDTMTKTSLLFLLVLSLVSVNFLTLIVLNYKKTDEEIKKVNLNWFRISITVLYSTLVFLIIIL